MVKTDIGCWPLPIHLRTSRTNSFSSAEVASPCTVADHNADRVCSEQILDCVETNVLNLSQNLVELITISIGASWNDGKPFNIGMSLNS